jgi:hypothetical protein
MRAELESARSDWEDAYRRLEAAVRDPSRQERILLELEIVTDELRKRIGATFELSELADEYRRADDWARAAIADRAPQLSGTSTLAVAEGAAFHLYSRGATDYEP